jgi:hypothetical protein
MHTLIYESHKPTQGGIIIKNKKKQETWSKKKEKEEKEEVKERKRKKMMIWWCSKTKTKILKRDSSLRKRVYPNEVYETTSQKKSGRRKVILSL